MDILILIFDFIKAFYSLSKSARKFKKLSKIIQLINIIKVPVDFEQERKNLYIRIKKKN